MFRRSGSAPRVTLRQLSRLKSKSPAEQKSLGRVESRAKGHEQRKSRAAESKNRVRRTASARINSIASWLFSLFEQTRFSISPPITRANYSLLLARLALPAWRGGGHNYVGQRRARDSSVYRLVGARKYRCSTGGSAFLLLLCSFFLVASDSFHRGNIRHRAPKSLVMKGGGSPETNNLCTSNGQIRRHFVAQLEFRSFPSFFQNLDFFSDKYSAIRIVCK